MLFSAPILTTLALVVATSAASILPLSTKGKITHPPASRFGFLDVPTPRAGPCDMITGPDGAEWVQYLFKEKIARIDPHTGHFTEYKIPFAGPVANHSLLPTGPLKNQALLACVIRNGKDGNIYAANGLRNQLVKLDMESKKVSVFTPPNALSALGNIQPLNDLWGAPEGMYFSQSSANLISLFDYKTHKVRSWKIPTPLSLPLGMRTAADGALWFTELAGQKIGRLNHTSGHIREFALPVPALLGPAVLRVQTEDRYIWFTGAFSDSIGRLDIYSHKFKAYPNTAPVSPAAVPSEDTIDNNRQIWFCTWTQNLLHKLNPKTGDMVHYKIPETALLDPISLPFGFGIGIDFNGNFGHNRMYFTQAALNRVGYFDID